MVSCGFGILPADVAGPMSSFWLAKMSRALCATFMASVIKRGDRWEIPYKYRGIAEKILYKCEIFHCHVWLPDGIFYEYVTGYL